MPLDRQIWTVSLLSGGSGAGLHHQQRRENQVDSGIPRTHSGANSHVRALNEAEITNKAVMLQANVSTVSWWHEVGTSIYNLREFV